MEGKTAVGGTVVGTATSLEGKSPVQSPVQEGKSFQASVLNNPVDSFGKVENTIKKQEAEKKRKKKQDKAAETELARLQARSKAALEDEEDDIAEKDKAASMIQARIRGRKARLDKKKGKGRWGRGMKLIKAKKGKRLPWGGRMPLETEIQLLLDKVKHQPATQKTAISTDGHVKTLLTYFKNRPGILNKVDKSGRSIMHYAVLNYQTKLLRAIMHEARKYPELDPDPLNLYHGPEGGEGTTPIQMACDVGDSGAAAMLLFHCMASKTWIRIADLQTIAESFPDKIAPYFNAMGLAYPNGGKNEVRQDIDRWPLQPGFRRVVSGSNAESSYKIGYWKKRKKKEKCWHRDATMLNRIDKALSGCELTPFLQKGVKSQAVCARVVGMPFIASIGTKASEAYCRKAAENGGPQVPEGFTGAEYNVLDALYNSGAEDVMGTTVMQVLLDFKWQTYAGRLYRWNLFYYFLYIVYYVISVTYIFPQPNPDEVQDIYSDPKIEVMQIVLAVWSTWLLGEALLKTARGNFQNNLAIMYAATEVTTFVMVLVGIALYFMHMDDEMKVASSVAALLQWTNLVFRVRCFSTTGPFIRITVASVLDCGPFMLLTGFYLVGFGQAFQLIFTQERDGEDDGLYLTLGSAIWWTMLMTLGEVPDTLELIGNLEVGAWFAKWVLFVGCMIFGFLVLLNLLIAIMATSYEHVMENGVEDDWRMEQAGVILSLEQQMSKADLETKKFFPKWLHVIYPSGVKGQKEQEKVLLTNIKGALDDLKKGMQSITPKQLSSMKRLRHAMKLFSTEFMQCRASTKDAPKDCSTAKVRRELEKLVQDELDADTSDEEPETPSKGKAGGLAAAFSKKKPPVVATKKSRSSVIAGNAASSTPISFLSGGAASKSFIGAAPK